MTNFSKIAAGPIKQEPAINSLFRLLEKTTENPIEPEKYKNNFVLGQNEQDFIFKYLKRPC